MTSPQNPQNSGPSFVGGAIDLGELKNRPQPNQTEDSGDVARFAEVTPETFEQDLVVRSTQVAVVLLLGTARSESSEQLKSTLGRLAQMQQEPVQWVARYVDVDTNGEIAQALQVKAVPTVVALAAGRPLTQFEGGQPEDQVQQWIDAVLEATEGKLAGLPGSGEAPADPRMVEGEAHLEAGDLDAAIAAYDEILAEDPSHAEAKAARANALLLQRAQDPQAHDADKLLLEGRNAEAFDLLIEEIKNSAGDEREEAKKRLFDLFAMFDAGDPDVIAARTKLSSALF